MNTHPFPLPGNLPEPTDDGAAVHLIGAQLADISLPATTGGEIHLPGLDRVVVFAYPRTGMADRHPGADWDAIPGARGCTPQSCAFGDLRSEFDAVKVGVIGLSTQTTAYQKEFAVRTHFPFPVLSDAELKLVKTMRLPTFEYDIDSIGGGGPDTLIKRMTWYVVKGVIQKVWYPVFPPDKNADVVLAWLRER